MKKIVALTLATAVAAGLFLSGCEMSETEFTDGSGSTGSSNGSSGQREVNVCSWGEYIDESLFEKFEQETGITVNYTTVPSNEELYSQLELGGVNYDVIVPSDYMIARLIAEDRLQPLDYSKIPNYEKIGEQYKGLSFDPNNEYTVPYTWGTLGIIYNTTMVDEPITSWEVMFSDEYAGNILLIDNSRDAFGMALYYLGYDVNTTDEAQIREAYQLVADAKSRGVYAGQGMDEIFQIMEGGNLAIASNWFVDAMCILKDAENVDEAHEWINFIASTDANLANMDFIGYASPNTEALEAYPEYYEATYGEPLDMDLYEIMAAPDSVLKNCSMYENLPAETLALYNDLWIELGT